MQSPDFDLHPDSLSFRFPGILSPKSKHFLTKPSTERTDDDVMNVLPEFEDIAFFQKFSNETKKELTKKVIYVTKEANTTLVEKGEELEAMYIIYSGVVSLKYQIPNISQETKQFNHWPERILKKGDYFGHQNLIHNRRSLLDIKCIGYSELLQIKKEDFNIVEDVLLEESKNLPQYMRSSEAIRRFQWSSEEYEVLELFSDLECFFEEKDISLDLLAESYKWSYFLVSGECKLARMVPLTISHKKVDKCLDSKANASEDLPSQNKNKTLEFEIVKQGFYFNVGEEFGDNQIYVTAASECLKVPRLLLKFKNKELLDKMARDLIESLPTNEDIVNNFLEYQHTTKEVEKALEEMFKDKPWRLSGCERKNQKPPFIKYV